MAHLDPHAVAIGTAVRAAITEAEMNISEFAKAAGFPRETLSRRINGHYPFTGPELMRVAAAAGMSAADLMARAERIIARKDAA